MFTSGSSGRPFAVTLDARTLSEARALMFLRAESSGWRPGNPMLQTGITLERGIVKRIKDHLLGVRYISAFNLTDAVLDRHLALIDDRRLRFVMGYPGSIYFLARRARHVGFNRSLDGVVCWGDNLYRHYRDEIETCFGCRVTDTYGVGEGIQVSAQCGEDHGHYHIFMPHVIVEVVDEDGRQLPAGTTGTLLLTRLTPGAMPLIRYRVGDMGRLSDAGACSCGRGLELMISIEGRDTDVVLTPCGNRLIVHFFTGIFEFFPSIDTFRITQHDPGAIEVEVVPRPDFRMEHWEAIKQEILTKGDPDLRIEFSLTGEIPLEKSNKRRFVVSHLRGAMRPAPLNEAPEHGTES